MTSKALTRAGALLGGLLLVGSFASAGSLVSSDPTGPNGPALRAGDDERTGPGPSPVDAYHPDKDTPVEPAWGGRVIIHLPSLPQNLCYPVENSAVTRWMLYEVHEFLLQQDWEYWDYRPRVAVSWDTEDTVILNGGRGEGNTNVLYGRVTDGGDHWVVTPVSPGHALAAPRNVPKSEVQSVERETVFTFHLRDGVKWHDGHELDADDVLYSWKIYSNPEVDCDSIRSYFTKVVHGEKIDERTVRFFYEKQYFKALDTLGDMCLIASHIYDLTDPDNANHKPDATLAEQAENINENPHNNDWIGLGPYKVTHWSQEYVQAERFDDYFLKDQAGYFDTIRWRHIASDDTAFQALINGELDFFYRIRGDDYFGEATRVPSFTDNYYKGHYYTGGFGYTTWNSYRPQLSDPKVRIALAHCFDWPEYIRTVAHGLAKQVTGPQFYFGTSYNHDVVPFPYDLEKAEEMLAEAGWYDRDGDDIIDKDGVPFRIEFMMPSGNKASEIFGQKLQENLEKVGIKLDVVQLEWASFLERIYDKDFDCANLAWSVPLESDPEQLWHSAGASKDHRGSNHSSVNDPYVDELIAKGQVELDKEKRDQIWQKLHRYLYEEVQPYLFGTNPPRKFGMNKKIRGFQSFYIDPGFSIRRWYYPAGTPGTRPTLER